MISQNLLDSLAAQYNLTINPRLVTYLSEHAHAESFDSIEVSFNFNVADIAMLTHYIKNNPNLKSFELISCFSGYEALSCLIDTLKDNTSITKLSLCNANIDDNGAAKVAELIECNTPIEILDLTNNRIDYKGGKMIVDALTLNTHLREMNTQSNRLTWQQERDIIQGTSEAERNAKANQMRFRLR